MSDEAPGGPPKDDDILRSAFAAALLGAAFALGALGAYGARAAWSVLVGTGIAVANLLAMRVILRALVKVPAEGEPSPSPGKSLVWGLLAVLKILLFFGGVWFLLTRRLVDPMPLVVGYGTLPLGIAASAVWSSLRGQAP